MEFRVLSDACALMGEIAASLRPGAAYREDFVLFSAVNCTTQSEDRQELKGFLKALLTDPVPVPLRKFVPQLTDLYRWLQPA